MPELPDVTVYIECLRNRIVDRALERVRLASPFVLRTYDPPITEADGLRVRGVERMGKRIVWRFEDPPVSLEGQSAGDRATSLFFVFHLMIAGRFRWRDPGAKLPGRIGLAAFDFSTGSLVMTEAGSKKRASLHVVRGAKALRGHDPGGLEVLDSDLARFRARLTGENHTLKRFLTSPRLVSGIGNAYSDEILHRARLSPLKWTSKLTDEEVERLFASTQDVLTEWTQRLRDEVGDGFPEKVTAFRKGMAVHGRYRKPCPRCGAPVQRIVYTSNETNYCALCQTSGKVYADRSLSRLLKNDWPRTIEEWEQLRN